MDPNHLLQAEIEHILEYLKREDPGSDEYNKAVQNLKVLYEARTKKPAYLVDPDTIVIVLGNLLGILLILQYERFNVVSTRALSLIVKPK